MLSCCRTGRDAGLPDMLRIPEPARNRIRQQHIPTGPIR